MPGILPPGTRPACVPHVDSFDVPIASNSLPAGPPHRHPPNGGRPLAWAAWAARAARRRRLKPRAAPPPVPCSAPYSAAVFIPDIVSLAAAIALTMLW